MLFTCAAPEYMAEGWRVIPLPPKDKFPPRKGYTGYDGKDPDRETVLHWFESDMKWRGNAGFNLAVVLPEDIIALDLDAPDGHRVKEDGVKTIEALESELGALPPTVTSCHGNQDNPYRHRLYRVPTGLHFDAVGGGVDTIQHSHRYLCAWPSVHPSGERYEWYAADGSRLGRVPTRDDIAPLPQAWLERMKTKPAKPRETPAGPMPSLSSDADSNGRCKAVQTVMDKYIADPTYGKSSRHDGFCKLAMVLAGMEAEGHHGAWDTALGLGDGFVSMVAPERKSESVAASERDGILKSAWDKFGGAGGGEDPCVTYRREKPRRRFKPVHTGSF